MVYEWNTKEESWATSDRNNDTAEQDEQKSCYTLNKLNPGIAGHLSRHYKTQEGNEFNIEEQCMAVTRALPSRKIDFALFRSLRALKGVNYEVREVNRL